MNTAGRVIAMVVVAGGLSAGVHVSADTQPGDAGWKPRQVHVEQYRNVIAANMFIAGSKQRAEQNKQKATAHENTTIVTPSPTPPPRDPGEAFVLVGVSVQGDTAIAFIEDRNQNRVHRVERHQAIAQGEIIAISLDGVTYSVGDKQRQIALQQTLAGTSPSSQAAGPTASPRAAQPTATGASAQTSDILERMRQRRNQATASPQASE